MPNYIISNNSFTMDIREVRKTRLFLLSEKIEQYAAELTLSSQELEWCRSAYINYCKQLELQNIELLNKNEQSKKSLQSDTVLFERYVVLKNLLLDKIENNQDLYVKYGINEPIPYNRLEKYDKINLLITTNDELIKSGSSSVLPQLMIENLKKLINEAKLNFTMLEQHRTKSTELTNQTNLLHNEDSIRLRSLYNWIVAFWGKRDVRLLDLGFVPMKTIKLSNFVKNVELSYLEQERKLVWNNVNGIDYYQVALRDNESTNNWIELHNEKINYCTLNGYDGNLVLKLRLRNKNGYSDWSPPVEINVESKH